MKEKKVVSIEDRIPALQTRRKKKANKQLIFYLVVFFLLICLIIYIQSPLSHLKTIQITGNTYLSDEEIIKKSKLSIQTNFWRVKESDVKERLEESLLVKDAVVKKKFPREVRILLTEYTKIGYFQEDYHYSAILEDGTMLPHTKELKGDAPVMIGFSDDEYLTNLTKELAELPRSVMNLISEIHWHPTDHNKETIHLYMNDGYLVKANIRSFARKMQFYPSIVMQLSAEDKGVIHMGVGAYFEEIQNDSQE